SLALNAASRMPEVRRHDADDCVHVLIHPDFLAKNIRAGGKPPLPETVADNGNFGDPRRVVLVTKHTTELGVDAEQPEIIWADKLRFNSLGFVNLRQIRVHGKQT